MTAEVMRGFPPPSPLRLHFADWVAAHLPDGTNLAVSNFSEGAFTLTYQSALEPDGMAAHAAVVCGDDFARDVAANGHEYVAERLVVKANRALVHARTR